jgi:pteridine reductase
MIIKGSTILVTGGARRIGRAICEALVRAGAGVVVQYHRSRTEAEALAAALRDGGGRVWTVQADLADPAAGARLIEDAAAAAGAPIDGLVNNAAHFEQATFGDLTADLLHAEFQINCFAPLLLMQALARQGRPGAVVNLLDRRIAGLDAGTAAYTLSKKALAEATRAAALAWAPRLTINAVAPGPALPPPDAPSGERVRDRAGHVPLDRDCPPAEIAEAVVFLLSAPGITGQCLFVDGGQHLLSDPQRHRAGPA